MNKKEIAEIKKNLSDDNGLFSLNRCVIAYIGNDNELMCLENKPYSLLDAEEVEVIFETMKKSLSGSFGKNLKEYGFPNTSYEDGGAQNILYKALTSKLEDEEINKALIERIRLSYSNENVYTVIISHCTYSVSSKNKLGEDDENENVYNFLMFSFCPMNTASDGLYYNSESGRVEKKSNTDLIISIAPSDAVLYPVFSDRAPDINNALVYTRTPKKPNLTLIEDFLDCEFIMTADSEKEKFHEILRNAVGDDLDLTVITKVNDILNDVIDQNKTETAPAKVDAARLKDILTDAGIDRDKLTSLPEIFETYAGENSDGLTAVNIVDNKTVLSASEITINVGKDSADKLRTGVYGGKRCIIIDLDDTSVEINGIETKLTEVNAESENG